ncbi:MAG: cytochrome c biogenesis protein CcsA [Actinomycetota bacterium]|nr:cytochrome c biogenesis protein CcsA [Actinomycetota bacterium]
MHSGQRLAPLRLIAFISVLLSLYLVFFYAPIDSYLGPVQKIFYIHFATAIIPYLAFLLVFLASVAYLSTRRRAFDRLAHAAAEVGLLIDTILLVTGTIFGKPTWGVWWVWEPRLTTSLIMWLLYAGYLMLRSMTLDGDKRASLSAVYGIAAFVSVPISFMSIRWWRSVHPLLISPSKINLDPSMWGVALSTLAAFTLLFFYLLLLKMELIAVQDGIDEVKEEMGDLI